MLTLLVFFSVLSPVGHGIGDFFSQYGAMAQEVSDYATQLQTAFGDDSDIDPKQLELSVFDVSVIVIACVVSCARSSWRC